MKVNQSILNRLYSSEIQSIDFDFYRNAITFFLRVIDSEKSRVVKLIFNEVLKYKVDKDWADEDWEVITVAEIFHLPELGKEYSIKEVDKREYDYLLDGDGFQIFIKANSSVLQNS